MQGLAYFQAICERRNVFAVLTQVQTHSLGLISHALYVGGEYRHKM